jgi:hypothetical protein
VVTAPAHPDLPAPAFLSGARMLKVPVEHAGQTIGTLELFKLAPAVMTRARPVAPAAAAPDSAVAAPR